MTKMCIPQKKRGPITDEWKSKAKEKFKTYINQNDWSYVFDEQGKKSKCDCEASYLSQMIFALLFYLNNFEVTISYSNSMTIDGYEYHFDVMNNPSFECPRNNKQNRIGAIAARVKGKEYAELKVWKEKYHSIGNFAPIPWLKDSENLKNWNLQNYHESTCYERWDLLLIYLQDHWDKKNTVTFNKYMILSGQVIYYVDVLNQYKAECQTITNVVKWYDKQCISHMDNRIKYDIINFNGESNNAKLDDDKVEETVKNINLLIELRGKIILGKLSNNVGKIDDHNFL